MKAIESDKFRIERVQENYEVGKLIIKNLETLQEFNIPITGFGEFKILLNEAEECLI